MRFVIPLFALLVIVGGSVAFVSIAAGRGEPVVQPIAFNHALHLDEGGLQCLECHTDAERSVWAGLPGKALCLDCHDVDEEGDAPDVDREKAKLFLFADSDQEIPWVRVAVTNPDIFFSHRRHTIAAKIDCLHCHTDQSALTAPPSTARLVMTMDECIDCHQENQTTTDCLACHR